MDVHVRKAHAFKFHPSPWFNGITGCWKKCSRCCLVILERFLSLRLDFSLSSLWNPLAIATEEKRLFPWLTFAGSGGRATHSMAIRVLFLALILLASPFLQVARCQSDSDEGTEMVEGGGDLGIVGEDDQDFGDGNFSPAPGVDTVCVFPKNTARLVPAGEETDLLVGVNNEGESSVNVIAIKASVHLPFDHKLLVQNLTAQAFNNASVPASAQATFPYIFAVSKYLQPGTFDLVGTIIYEIDQQPYQNTFYNGTIEVVEADGFLSIESVFLVTLGIALLGLCGLWVYGQIQHLSKKTKRAPKVEVGTGTTDASMDEWLQGTAYAQSLSKSKKKK